MNVVDKNHYGVVDYAGETSEVTACITPTDTTKTLTIDIETKRPLASGSTFIDVMTDTVYKYSSYSKTWTKQAT
jgi:hypothetical protein